MTDVVIQFRDAMQAVFGPLDWLPVPDGAIHRFHVPGDRQGSHNGWYVLYVDGMGAGAFGSWRQGGSQSWSSRLPADHQEVMRFDRKFREIRRKQEAERIRLNEVAAQRAQRMWSQAQPASAKHPYLSRKHVMPYRLRQLGSTLLIPLYCNGLLVNLQRIMPDGSKRFMVGGKVRGCYSLIGTVRPDRPLYICEGWATGATLHADKGEAVACAMNANNLLEAGHQLRRTYPHNRLLIAADDDRKTASEGKGNPGVEAANKAAAQLGCMMVMPVFPPDAPLELSDFNDLANWRAGR